MKEELITFETAKLLKSKGFFWQHIDLIPKPKGTVNLLEDPATSIFDRMIVVGDVEGKECFNEDGKEIAPKQYNPANPHYPRPSQSLLAKWLREKHFMYIDVDLVSSAETFPAWTYRIDFIDPSTTKKSGDFYFINHVHAPMDEEYNEPVWSTYEEAMENALQFAIKIIGL